MSNKTVSELENWEEIINDASGGNDDRKTIANVKVAQKLVLSIVNLQQAMFSFQKVIAPRVDQLRESIDRFNDSSAKLYKIYLVLTGIIAFLTFLNVVLISFQILK